MFELDALAQQARELQAEIAHKRIIHCTSMTLDIETLAALIERAFPGGVPEKTKGADVSAGAHV